MNRPALHTLLGVIVLITVFSAPGSTSSPPENICGVCSDPFQNEARHHDVDLTIEHSELTIAIDEDGTGHWTARVVVNDAAGEQFSHNRSMLDAVVTESLAQHRSAVDDPRDLQTTVDGDTIVVTFSVPGMAHRGTGGILLVDYFNTDGRNRYYHIDSNTLTVRGPEGTVLANDPPEATRVDGAAVWTSTDDSYDSLDDGTFVTFGPDRGLETLVAAQLSIATTIGPLMVTHLLIAASLPTLVLGSGLVVVLKLIPRFDGERAINKAVYVLAGATVFTVFGWVVFDQGRLGPWAIGSLIGTQLLAVGVYAREVSRDWTIHQVLAVSVVPALAIILGAAFVGGRVYVREVITMAAMWLAAITFVPLGFAARRGRTRPFVAAILLAPVVALYPAVPIGGFGPGFEMFMLSIWAILTVVAGAIFFQFGWALGSTRPANVRATRSRAIHEE